MRKWPVASVRTACGALPSGGLPESTRAAATGAPLAIQHSSIQDALRGSALYAISRPCQHNDQQSTDCSRKARLAHGWHLKTARCANFIALEPVPDRHGDQKVNARHAWALPDRAVM